MFFCCSIPRWQTHGLATTSVVPSRCMWLGQGRSKLPMYWLAQTNWPSNKIFYPQLTCSALCHQAGLSRGQNWWPWAELNPQLCTTAPESPGLLQALPWLGIVAIPPMGQARCHLQPTRAAEGLQTTTCPCCLASLWGGTQHRDHFSWVVGPAGPILTSLP